MMKQGTTEPDRPIRIAIVMGKYVTGGIKSVIMNYYRNVDRDQIQFDLIVDDDSPNKDHSEVEELGGRVFEIPSTQHPVLNVRACARILWEGRYLCVHGYLNTLNVFPMCAGALAGVPVRIAENLSTAHPGERKTILKNILRPFATLFPTHLAANSRLAAEWLYGKKRASGCRIIPNALDMDHYRYDPELCAKKRKELGLDGYFVLGHIGRYDYQKNHAFLIDIFYETHKRDPAARLLLIGYGPMKEEIFRKITKLGLRNYVIDYGQTEDIQPLYNAMDCFVLPSFYEGLPVVGIEAQATGLPCVLSSEITRETKITDSVVFLDLKDSPGKWAEAILRWKGYNRKSVTEQIAWNGYSITHEAPLLQEYYLNCLKR